HHLLLGGGRKARGDHRRARSATLVHRLGQRADRHDRSDHGHAAGRLDHHHRHRPQGISLRADGHRLGTAQLSHTVGRITPDLTMTRFTTPDLQPFIMAPGPDGKLWFSDTSTGTTTRVNSVDTTGMVTNLFSGAVGTTTDGVATGSDGNIWF